MHVSLRMIVRDEAPRIVRCLESALPYVDRAVVIDTGSTDRTVELARAAGAEVVPFRVPHAFDHAGRLIRFDLAREASRVANAGIDDDVHLWLDADDVLHVDDATQLADAFAAFADDAEYPFRYARYRFSPTRESWRERAYKPRRCEWREWVHETLWAPCPPPTYPAHTLPLWVEQEDRQRPKGRWLHVYEAMRAAGVKLNGRHWFKLSEQLFEVGRHQEGLQALMMATRSRTAEYAALARCELGAVAEGMQDFENAWNLYAGAFALHSSVDALRALARLAYGRGDAPRAIAWCEAALESLAQPSTRARPVTLAAELQQDLESYRPKP